ncbi:MAG: hypothetical protein ACP5UC_00420, partial [Candidatus Micrarchaeia archaeon]
FTVPSQYPKSSIKIFDINIPTFYSNVSGILGISALYTGVKPNNISISLIGPPTITVINNTQSFQVLPNTVLLPRFKTLAHSSGTYVMTLFVSGPGINESYTFDIIVLPEPATATTIPTTTTIAQKAFVLPGYSLYWMVVAAGAVFLIVLTEIHKKARSKYNPERAKKLKELEEHIKRVE